MVWIEGTWRLWMPLLDGAERLTTYGGDYSASAIGQELDVTDTEGEVSSFSDPFYFQTTDSGWMLFADDGVITAAITDDYLADWSFTGSALVEGTEGGWDEVVGGPALVFSDDVYWMYYSGADGASSAIGLATSGDASTYTSLAEPVLEPAYDYDAGGISQPTVAWDGQVGRWRMYYSAWDGSRWTIGHAYSLDLLTWTADEAPSFAVDGVDVAAPAISSEVGRFLMWYSRREDGGVWTVGQAVSPDGRSWTDLGAVLDHNASVAIEDAPPRVALSANPERAFSIEGENSGPLRTPLTPGTDYEATTNGWTARAVVGYWLGTQDAGPESWEGITLDSADPDAGLVWLTLVDARGEPSIGVATVAADGTLTAAHGAVLSADGGFDAGGVYSAVVAPDDDGYLMIYAGLDADGAPTLGRATSDDGLSWTRDDQVLDLDEAGWDAAGLVPGSLQRLDDGSWRLWYTGSNGDLLRIGTAGSADGITWTRVEGSSRPWAFAPGSPGEWDDSGVRDPYVISDESGDHLWYSGYDGEAWRLGYAFREAGGTTWERSRSEQTDETRPILTTAGSLFHPDGVRRPVAVPDGDGWWVWYAGYDGDIARVGAARGLDPDRLHKAPLLPTLGDALGFRIEGADEDAEAIPLDTQVDGIALSGLALSGVTVDEERGFLYVTSSQNYVIIVIDIRDDSDGTFEDLNYLDVEAVLRVDDSALASGQAGFRQVLPVPGTDVLLALDQAPEAVLAIDLSLVPDDAYGDWVDDVVVASLPTARGFEEDDGVDTQSTVGPARMALHPDGRRLLVTNFNANSVGVYDLTLGTAGQQVGEVTSVGENPYALAISPDGLYAVVANYTGEVAESGETSGTLAVLDLDESSPTYLEVRTWVTNR